jgi:sRNA-binding carbon storage regulator CsrA
VLVLECKLDKAVRVRINGKDCWVKVIEIKRQFSVVKLGFDAPLDFDICREELLPVEARRKAGTLQPRDGSSQTPSHTRYRSNTRRRP